MDKGGSLIGRKIQVIRGCLLRQRVVNQPNAGHVRHVLLREQSTSGPFRITWIGVLRREISISKRLAPSSGAPNTTHRRD